MFPDIAGFAAPEATVYNDGVDFERVLKALLAEFERDRVRYAAIGGFALGILGHVRATMDLDFLVDRDDLDKVHERLTALGYERFLQTENVSQYRHRDEVWGGVDFIHAFRKSSLAMLERAKKYPVFDGKQAIRAADPEDVIGMKVQAMTNDPDRKPQELADIEALMRLYGSKLDWERVQEYYDIFGIGDDGKRMKERFGRVK